MMSVPQNVKQIALQSFLFFAYALLTALLGYGAYFLSSPMDTGGKIVPPEIGLLFFGAIFLVIFFLALLCKKYMQIAHLSKGILDGILALFIALPTLFNLYMYPPIDDGAYYIVRYGYYSCFNNALCSPSIFFEFLLALPFLLLFSSFCFFTTKWQWLNGIVNIIVACMSSFITVKIAAALLYKLI